MTIIIRTSDVTGHRALPGTVSSRRVFLISGIGTALKGDSYGLIDSDLGSGSAAG